MASHFLPALFGVEVSSAEHKLLSLRLQMGGLEIVNPVTSAPSVDLHPSTPPALSFELDSHIATASLAKDQH